MRAFLTIWTLLLLSQGSPPALAAPPGFERAEGTSHGGGGNDAGIEFAALAKTALGELAASGLYSATPEHLQRLRGALEGAKIIALDGTLNVPVGLLTQGSLAVNDPDAQMIEIDAEYWATLEDGNLKKAITVHELEGLLRQESTGVYQLSAEYLAYLGTKKSLAEAVEKVRKEDDALQTRAKEEGRAFQCVYSATVLNKKTGELSSSAVRVGDETGTNYRWTLGDHQYELSFFDGSRPIRPAAPVQRFLFTQGEIVDRRGGKPGQSLETQNVRRVVRGRHGLEEYPATFEVTLSPVGPGVVFTAPVNGPPGRYTADRTEFRQLANGDLIVTVSSGNSLPDPAFEVLNTTNTCKYTTENEARLKQRLPPQAQSGVRAFRGAFETAAARTQAWEKCVRAPSAAGCEDETRALGRAKAALGLVWKKLLPISDWR